MKMLRVLLVLSMLAPSFSQAAEVYAGAFYGRDNFENVGDDNYGGQVGVKFGSLGIGGFLFSAPGDEQQLLGFTYSVDAMTYGVDVNYFPGGTRWIYVGGRAGILDVKVNFSGAGTSATASGTSEFVGIGTGLNLMVANWAALSLRGSFNLVPDDDNDTGTFVDYHAGLTFWFGKGK